MPNNWEALVTNGGFVAVIAILGFVAWNLFKLYKSEKISRNKADNSKVVELAALAHEMRQHEDDSLNEQRERYKEVLKDKDALIAAAEKRTIRVQSEANKEIKDLLVEQTKTVHQFTGAVTEMTATMSRQLGEVVSVLQG